MKHPTATHQLVVVARSPFYVYYEGPAAILSATNSVGRFDILPGHADFFSVLIPNDIIIEPDADQSADPIVFKANNGIITVRDDKVMLFVNM